jgi:hypothetical protein
MNKELELIKSNLRLDIDKLNRQRARLENELSSVLEIADNKKQALEKLEGLYECKSF